MSAPQIVGVLLAGGLARRMGGGDKCLLQLGSKTLLEHAIDRSRGQVTQLIINANGAPERFAEIELPVVPDSLDGFLGPLAGILAAMEWAVAAAPHATHIASIATDTPFFPLDMVARLDGTRLVENADIVMASSSGRVHPVFGLWPIALAAELRHALQVEELRKIDLWAGRYKVAHVDFSAEEDPFFNINSPTDLELASRR